MSRGRPRKISDGDGNKEEIRQKGRMAQKRLKKKRLEKIALLEDQVGLLQRTVEEMSKEFLDFTDSIVSSAQLTDQPRILDNLKGTTVRFLNLAVAAELQSNEETTFHSRQLPSVPMSKNSLQIRDAPVWSLSETHSSKDSFSTPITLSPTPFDFATLFAPSVPKTRQWPMAAKSPWKPYLIAGPKSFAGRLYIDAMTFVFKVLRGEISRPGFIPSVARHYLRHERLDSMAELVRLQLVKVNARHENSNTAMRKYNSTAQDQEDAPFDPVDYDSINHILARVAADVYQEDLYLKDWLDPLRAQQYITDNWNMELTSTSVQIRPCAANRLLPFGNSTESTLASPADNSSLVPASTGTPGYETGSHSGSPILYDNSVPSNGHTLHMQNGFSASAYSTPIIISGGDIVELDLILSPQALIMELLPESVCFGDGPRFSREKIDVAVEAFLMKAINANNAV